MVKRSKLFTQQPKTVEKPNIITIRSVTIEPPEISCKVSKTRRQAKNVSQVGASGKKSASPVYSETTKANDIFAYTKNKKNVKIVISFFKSLYEYLKHENFEFF